MEKFVVIMAGGVGSRFWPRSRKTSPKQLLNIFGEQTMIQETVSRLDGLVKPENIFIITNKVQKALIEEQLPELPADNVIAEPVGRNTAPCVGLASVVIGKRANDGVIITLPADHVIKDKVKFHNAINLACEYAYNDKGLVTFGITPTRPETGYGYININKEEVTKGVWSVNKFVEKPNLEKAKEYLKEGNYLWNSGMFIWRADVIAEEIKEYLPSLHQGLKDIDEAIDNNNFLPALAQIFPAFESISVDYGIMEHSKRVFLVEGNFDWSDVGSWETVYELGSKDENNNCNNADVLNFKSSGNYTFSKEKFVALVGVENMIVIDTKDAILVCNRDNTQDVKKVVDYLNDKNKTDLV